MSKPGPDQSSWPKGEIEISDHGIIAVVQEAVLSSHGVAAMAPRSVRFAIGNQFGILSVERGIDVAVSDNSISSDLSVVVEYGTPNHTDATNTIQKVKLRVRAILGTHVPRVNINVDGLRITRVSGGSA